jgi:hypothetical protein
MAYLPGVPDTGSSGGIAAVARSVGKPGRTQHLGSVVGRRGAGMSSIGGGDPGLHSVNHYGKTAPPLLGGGLTGGVNPTAHAGVKMIRGGSGGIRSNVREGGLGPGKMSTPGPSFQNYSIANNQDVE